jgi:hypothetical protein
MKSKTSEKPSLPSLPSVENRPTGSVHGRRTLIICITIVTLFTEWLVSEAIRECARLDLLREMSRPSGALKELYNATYGVEARL